ncbi:MAG TPA: winged helix-turn-helix transcriptional regulator [Candidatus Diapherotrites archaeon]|uniref:Winged helix-turn-helix transcriptional regulator n=1 Tax=Candidatus Iainarchaeum sp. TaxID=3101447 RepID=A0A7J4JHC9_9ARCH|nr:winged helix-turn-helix transcriptional regulator [Candidatus Diapherotrites archaeon]
MDDAEQALELNVRNRLYDAVNESPGLHFRELQRRTGIAVGSLQYHLDFLERVHLVRKVREGKFTRYYSVRGEQLGEGQRVMSLIRQDSIRRIVLFLLHPRPRQANNLEISRGIGLSPSTVSWHLQKMLEANLALKEQRGREAFFSLANPVQVAQLLVQHRKSFLDELVNNFAEVWQQI